MMRRSVEGLRVTPWADWFEWYELKGLLEEGRIRQANERVESYTIRRRNAVPVAMVSTVSLRYQMEYPAEDQYSQRLGLAMALVRFVNGMTDRLQPRGEGAFAKSVHGLALELKLPLILVEIRHQASHNNLPRLSALEGGANKALKWLEEHYWDAQYQRIRPSIDDTRNELRNIFRGSSKSESCSIDLRAPFEEPIHRTSEEDKGSVLPKLMSLANAFIGKAREREHLDHQELGRRRRSGEKWVECENRAEWKVMPIGLLPGQHRAPRWEAKTDDTRETESESNDVSEEVHQLQYSPSNDAGLDNRQNANTEEPHRPLKRLRAKEAEKIAQLTTYYERLLRAPPVSRLEIK